MLGLMNHVANLCPVAAWRGWELIMPRLRQVLPNTTPREVLVNTEVPFVEETENEVPQP